MQRTHRGEIWKPKPKARNPSSCAPPNTYAADEHRRENASTNMFGGFVRTRILRYQVGNSLLNDAFTASLKPHHTAEAS